MSYDEARPMTQSGQANPTIDCLYATICGFLLPFFLTAAGGNLETAHAAILELIDAYNPATPVQLDLVGRVIGFSTAAMDNLRLSMGDGLSDTKVLQYRSNAVSLSRAAEQARQILQAIQTECESIRPISLPPVPRPCVAATPNPAASAAKLELPYFAATAVPPSAGTANLLSANIEAMKHDARVMLAAFSKHGAQASTAITAMPDPNASAKSGAIAAVAAAARG
jgi:hypothetical protein